MDKKRCLLTILSLTTFALLSVSQVINDKYVGSKKENQQGNFITFFPDTALAMLVAEQLNKKVTDNVTTKELASIKGYFEVGPGDVSKLTGIGYLIGLDTFDCYKNDVTEIPAEIGKLTNLKYLDLCKAFSLNIISPEIGKLKKLKKIRLCLTEVKSIPKEIGYLTNLKTLWLCCNEFTEIPKEIGNLKKLKDLDIHSNKITNLPNEICNLKSLTSLDISYCGLERLSDSIGNLKELEFLNLFGNNLKLLPKSIEKLDNLGYLNVFDNFKLSENYKNYLPVLLRKRRNAVHSHDNSLKDD